jgi:hypothetical protein
MLDHKSPVQQQPVARRKRKLPWLRLLLVGIVALIILFGLYKGGEAAYKALFMQTVSSEKIDEKAVLEELNRIAVLPDEPPQIATVSDPEAVRKQSEFFANAQEGDLIIAFLKARQIIIYRPSDGKIVNMSVLGGE